MKRTAIYLLVAAASIFALASCNKDELSAESVITVSNNEKNDFDKWLDVNYIDTYNIRFVYRYEEIESNYNFYTVPADFNAAVKMAHILKHVCLEAYDEVAGIDFTRANFPKLVCCTGQWLYRNNGTFVGGSAEGGRKINLEGLNNLDTYMRAGKLNEYYLHMVHHEFTHILNQTKNYSTSFQTITGKYYVGGVWSESPYSSETYYLSHGFVTSYSQQEVAEDFAEVLSEYLTTSDDEWNLLMTRATSSTEQYNDANGTELQDGATVIKAKLDEVRNYMKDSWGIDIDEMRTAVQRREKELTNGTYDMMDLTIRN